MKRSSIALQITGEHWRHQCPLVMLWTAPATGIEVPNWGCC